MGPSNSINAKPRCEERGLHIRSGKEGLTTMVFLMLLVLLLLLRKRRTRVKIDFEI